MDFLESVDKLYYELVFGIIFIIGYLIVRRKNNLSLILQYVLCSYGITLLLYSLSIPHVFPGFPYDASDLENKRRLLYYLQRNNEAVVKITEAFRDIAFLTFVVIFSISSNYFKYLRIDKSVE